MDLSANKVGPLHALPPGLSHHGGEGIAGVPASPMSQCAGCKRPILDRFLLNFLDREWHTKCVQCCDCKSNLTEKCFFREGQIYCREDFFR